VENSKFFHSIFLLALIFSLALNLSPINAEETEDTSEKPAARIDHTKRDSYGLTDLDRALFKMRQRIGQEQIYAEDNRTREGEELLPENLGPSQEDTGSETKTDRNEFSALPYTISNICTPFTLTSEERQLLNGPKGNPFILACAGVRDIVEMFYYGHAIAGPTQLADDILRNYPDEVQELLDDTEVDLNGPTDEQGRLIEALRRKVDERGLGQTEPRPEGDNPPAPQENTQQPMISLDNPLLKDFDKLVFIPPPNLDNDNNGGLIPPPVPETGIEGYGSPELEDYGIERLIPYDDEQQQTTAWQNIKTLFRDVNVCTVSDETKEATLKAAGATAATGGFMAFLWYLDKRLGLVLPVKVLMVCPETVGELRYQNSLMPSPKL